MDQYIDTAYNVTTALFGPNSGIPWWAWFAVVLALFYKVLLPEPTTTADRDELMITQLTEGMGNNSGRKKGKKKK